MKRIDPNLLFFGNMVDGSERLLEFERFREHIDGFLRREKDYFEKEAHPDLELEFLPLFADTFPPILHSSIIISVVILLELEMRGYCKALQNALRLDLRFGDLAGTILERFRAYVTKVAKLPLDDNHVRWEDTVGIFEIRNCLVHSGGHLAEFPRATVVRALATRHQTPQIDDDRLTIGSDTSELALNVASAFLDGIYELAISRFPGHYGPRRR